MQTGQTLDMAIEGQGMFVVRRPDDTAADAQSFTRDGSFRWTIMGLLSQQTGSAFCPTRASLCGCPSHLG